MGLGLGLGIQFKNSLGRALSEFLTWGQSIPARFWGTETPEYWGGLDAQAEVHYNRVIADGGVVPAGLGGVNSFFQVVKAIYGTSDINTAISAAYDPHYLGYKLGAGSGTTLGQAAQTLYSVKGIFGGIGTGSAYWEGVGVIGNNVTTPAIVSPSTQVDVVSYVYASAGHTNSATILSNDGANRNFVFNCSNVSTGILQLRAGTPFTNFNSTTGVGNFDNYTGWIRATYNQNGINGDVTFYTSTNSPNTPINSITWVQLGSVVSSASTGLQTGTHSIQLGSNQGSNIFIGRIGIAAFSTSIGGSPSVLFNANQYTGANTWTSTTGEVWTVNSTGAGLADVTQTTAASQPLLLAHTGENYWWNSGVAGNFVTTPNAAVNQITGDIELTAQISPTALNVDQNLINKSATSGTLMSYNFFLNASGGLSFAFSPTGSVASRTTVASTATLASAGLSANTIFWVRASRNATTGAVQFFTSTNGTTFTQLGTTISSITGNLFVTTEPLYIGTWANVLFFYTGRIFRATISNSIGGTPVVDFNPASYNPATSQTQWTSATGEVWSINVGTAATGYKGVLVDRTIVQGDGIDDTLLSGVLTNVQYHSLHLALNPLNIPPSGGAYYFDGGNANGLIYGNVDGLIVFNGADLNFTGDLEYRLQYCQADFNNTSSNLYLNNSNNVTGSTGTRTTTRNNLFSNGIGGSFGNAIISTAIRASVIDNSTQRTALYDYVRQINNNAF